MTLNFNNYGPWANENAFVIRTDNGLEFVNKVFSSIARMNKLSCIIPLFRALDKMGCRFTFFL